MRESKPARKLARRAKAQRGAQVSDEGPLHGMVRGIERNGWQWDLTRNVMLREGPREDKREERNPHAALRPDQQLS